MNKTLLSASLLAALLSPSALLASSSLSDKMSEETEAMQHKTEMKAEDMKAEMKQDAHNMEQAAEMEMDEASQNLDDTKKVVKHQNHDNHASKAADDKMDSMNHAGHKMMDHNNAVTEGAEAMIGDLSISGAWARATPPAAKVGAAYLTIKNNSENEDRLISVQSSAAGHTEIHNMTMEDGVMQMRQLEEGVVIAAGETISLKPGGKHIMMFELTGPMVAKEMVGLTLNFENAGQLEMIAPIKGLN